MRNVALHNANVSQTVVTTIISRKMRWAEYVHVGEERRGEEKRIRNVRCMLKGTDHYGEL